MTRAVVVDDDPGARRALCAALDGAPGLEVVGEFEDGRTALAGIRRLRPDVAFLDIEMAGPDGLEIAAQLGCVDSPAIVFVTAHERHAVDAFDLQVVDYVLKPFEDARVIEAARRAARRIAASPGRAPDRPPETAPDAGPAGYARRFLVRAGGRHRFVPVERVDWLEADANYVVLHAGSETFRLRGNLSVILEGLDPQRFARIHRSVVVNLDRIAEVQPWFNGDHIAILHDGRQLRVSRSYRRGLLKPLS